MAPYRPPGRSNRSGRTQADNDVFEGLPVKQWTHVPTRFSLNPPTSDVPGEQGHDRWGEPPMPRDWQILQPWTQQLLKLARSGKLGQKRKAFRDAEDADGEDYGAREDDAAGADDANGLSKGSMLGEDRAFIAKKWRHVSEHAHVPEHRHLEFLAKSRKGMPSFYHSSNSDAYAVIPTRKTKVFRVIDAATAEIAVYEIIVPEGQPLENEVLEGSEHASKEPVILKVGTFIEGLGTANPEGVLVADIKGAAAVAQRRNRPPPKKKGGPGRGKKRVTFTNPDGSTYTTIVPNATKIVPQPGQTVKHVAKGEEAARDITAEEAASMKAAEMEHDGEGEGDEDGDDDEEGDDDGDENDDREDGQHVEEATEIDIDTDTKPSTPVLSSAPVPASETAATLSQALTEADPNTNAENDIPEKSIEQTPVTDKPLPAVVESTETEDATLAQPASIVEATQPATEDTEMLDAAPAPSMPDAGDDVVQSAVPKVDQPTLSTEYTTLEPALEQETLSPKMVDAEPLKTTPPPIAPVATNVPPANDALE